MLCDVIVLTLRGLSFIKIKQLSELKKFVRKPLKSLKLAAVEQNEEFLAKLRKIANSIFVSCAKL